MICHNGEINTMRGNVNWMAARRHTMCSEVLGDDLDSIWPLIPEGQSDSDCFDNALELLYHTGRSLPHAMMMLIPEAWEKDPEMPADRKAFYEFHGGIIEPWDGPASIAFTDGTLIGATLDRNGLRPARYLITDDDTVVMASEMGVLDKKRMTPTPMGVRRIVRKTTKGARSDSNWEAMTMNTSVTAISTANARSRKDSIMSSKEPATWMVKPGGGTMGARARWTIPPTRPAAWPTTMVGTIPRWAFSATGGSAPTARVQQSTPSSASGRK